MPGFGKSGTCRMRCFRACMMASLVAATAYRKLTWPARWDLVVYTDLFDARAWRPAANLAFESPQGFLIAFGQDFDGAVEPVLHPAAQSFESRGFFGEPPEPHALDPATQQEAF